MKRLGFLAICVLVLGCSLFRVNVPVKPPVAVVAPVTTTPSTPAVTLKPPTVGQTQVRILSGGWICLIVGILLLAATLAIVPMGAKLYTGSASVLLILLWPVSSFVSFLVPYLPIIGGVILFGGFAAVILIVWRMLKDVVLSVEDLHSLPSWPAIKAVLSAKQKSMTRGFVKELTEKGKVVTT